MIALDKCRIESPRRVLEGYPQNGTNASMQTRESSTPARSPLRLIAVCTLSWIGTGCALPQHESAEMPTETEPQSVRIERAYDAPPETIWAAWTDPRIVRRWFGSDPNGEVLAAYLHVKAGGRFEVTFANGDGTQYTAMGVYRRVEPFRHLEFSWGWKNEPGVETSIRVEMSPEGAGTRMAFEHAGLIHLSTHDYASGWRSTFEKMEKAISSGL